MADIKIERIEKSNVMEDHYQESDDPWGNRKRNLYQTILKQGAIKLYDYFKKYNPDKKVLQHYDIGAGGGNIIDTMLQNKPEDIEVKLSGCDISESAIGYLNETYKERNPEFEVLDCEEYSSSTPSKSLRSADVLTVVDVMYYWGDKRDYRKTLDEIWDSMKVGSIILVADSIIPYQRRTYLKGKPNCLTLEEYTDYTAPVGALGANKMRYLKVKIYMKRGE